MKTKPKDGQKFWFIDFGLDSSTSSSSIEIDFRYARGNGLDLVWDYNMFDNKKKAISARAKIIKILKEKKVNEPPSKL